MTNVKSSRKGRCSRYSGRVLALAFVLTCSSPFAAAHGLSKPVTIKDPGLVRMIDGRDPGTDVTIRISAPRLWREGYDFGYVDGQSFHSLLDACNWENTVFSGGQLVDFTLRKRSNGDDSEGGDQYYRLSDAENFAVQDYFGPINPASSRNPIVTDPYYRRLTLFWDPDQDHDRDIKVTLTVESRFDGMQYVTGSPSPVPLPSSLWLLGSGSLMLAVLGILKKRPRQSSQVF